MDDQQILENSEPGFLTLSYADQVLGSHSDQLSDRNNIILQSDDCHHLSPIGPLNDLLLGQTFTIETDDQPFFVSGEQLITFHRPTGLNEQEDNIQTVLTNEPEKPIENEEINFSTKSDDFFPEINIDFSKVHSDNNTVKTIDDCDDLTERLDILSNIDIDVTKNNYSNSMAIQILEDVANSPTNTNGHFVCDLCLHEFYNWQNYKKHKLEHLNDKPFKCLKCLKSFNYNNNYLLHIASHFPNNLKCPQCKKEFKRLASFKAHLKIHRTEESITCNICNTIFDNQHRLDIHKENCMQENVISRNSLNNTVEINPGTCYTTCKTCKRSLSSLSDYRKHVKEHKKFDLVLKKQYKFAMRVKKMLKKRNSVKRFKCDHCDWSFNKSNLLRRHMRTHTGEKPFECSNCSKYFTQENSLNRHLLKHTGLRPFKCEFCEMSFSQKGHLINHIKICHAVTKEATRIHKCTMCSCVYNSLNALNKHLNVYHGVKNKKSKKNVQNHVPKCVENVETNDIIEPINLIKDPSNLEKWLEEVAQELQIGKDDNNSELMHCDDQISVPSEFGLNLIETEDYDDIDRDFNLMSNSKNNTATENLICPPQNGIIYIVTKKNSEQAAPIKYQTVVKNQRKTSMINANTNESIPLSMKETTKNVVPNESISLSLKKPTKNVVINNNENESISSKNEISKTVALNGNANKLIPSSVNETTDNLVLNHNFNESIPSTIEKSTKNVAIDVNVSESIPLSMRKTTTKMVVINANGNELIPSTSVQETKKDSPRKKSTRKISKLDANIKSFKKRKIHTLNSKINSVVSNTSNKTEPKVLYLPNITTNVEPENTEITLKAQPKVCEYCGKMFKKNADLERHKRIHTGDKPYKCDEDSCNKAFATKSSLDYHLITHLGKMKRAVCPQCNGLFATSSSMKVHMRQHTGEKPYKCPVCGDAFRTSGHLHTHVIIHERKAKRK